MYCKKCGVLSISKEILCPECNEPIELKDKKCFVCGNVFEETKEDIDEKNNLFESEKEEFIDFFRKRRYGIETDFLLDELRNKLQSYPTVTILFSDDCPEELENYYNIKNKENTAEKLEDLAKSFFKEVMKIPLMAGRYVNIVESIICYLGERRIESEEAIRKAVSVILRCNEEYYKNLLMMTEERDAQIFIIKSWTINCTMQMNYRVDMRNIANIVSTRAGLMFRLGEIFKNNRYKKEEFKHLYVNSFFGYISAIDGYWFDKDYRNANGLLKRVSSLILQNESHTKEGTSYECAERILTIMRDSVEEAFFEINLPEQYYEGVNIALNFVLEILNLEIHSGESAGIVVGSMMIVEKLMEMDPLRIFESKIINNFVQILLRYYKESINSFVDYIEELGEKIENKFKKKLLILVVDTVNESDSIKTEEKNKIIKKVKEKLLE
jgi:hypothetical protein